MIEVLLICFYLNHQECPRNEFIIEKVEYGLENIKTSPRSNKDQIEAIGKENGLEDWEIQKLINIANCESRLDPKAQNSISSAAGIYQIIRGTWQAYSILPFDEYKYNAEENIYVAIQIYKDQGLAPWICK